MYRGKIKTNRGTAKRFKIKKNGKVKFWRAKRRHNMTNTSTKTNRQNRGNAIVAAVDAGHIHQLMPYG
ncbi:MAG: 50S ribosomal protein L35 [Myxococcota bacterium]|nr:50S ribosomal protein L35 [Myxococcota bacterium]